MMEPIVAAMLLGFAALVVVAVMEVLGDHRLALLAVLTMAVACGLVCCAVLRA
jgi:hypothetical protein